MSLGKNTNKSPENFLKESGITSDELKQAEARLTKAGAINQPRKKARTETPVPSRPLNKVQAARAAMLMKTGMTVGDADVTALAADETAPEDTASLQNVAEVLAHAKVKKALQISMEKMRMMKAATQEVELKALNAEAAKNKKQIKHRLEVEKAAELKTLPSSMQTYLKEKAALAKSQADEAEAKHAQNARYTPEGIL